MLASSLMRMIAERRFRGVRASPDAVSTPALQSGGIDEGEQVAKIATTSGVSARYATALFELADESDALDAVGAQLATLAGALDGSDELRAFIASPVVSREAQASAIGAICEKAGVGAPTSSLVGLMASKRRLFALPGVISAFQAMLAERRGVVTAEVTAAQTLTEAQVATLTDSLKTSVGKDIDLKITIDEALIGGLVVKVGSRMIDTSIRSKLSSLQTAMKEVG